LRDQPASAHNPQVALVLNDAPSFNQPELIDGVGSKWRFVRHHHNGAIKVPAGLVSALRISRSKIGW